MGCTGSKDSSDTIKKTDPEATVSVGSHMQTYQDLTGFPQFPSGTKSLLNKYLTKEIWLQLCDKRDKFKFSFKEAIFSGC